MKYEGTNVLICYLQIKLLWFLNIDIVYQSSALIYWYKVACFENRLELIDAALAI